MTDPTDREETRRVYARLYYHKNKERLRSLAGKRKDKIRTARQQHYQQNKEELKAKSRAYSRQKKAKRNARERNSRANSGAFAEAERSRHLRRYSTCRRYRLRVLSTNAKLRARQNGMEAESACFEPLLVSPPESCRCCGLPMDYESRRTPRSPSLDRVLNERGYVSGNVAVICFRCNSLKKDGTIDDFERILAYMRSVIASSAANPSLAGTFETR